MLLLKLKSIAMKVQISNKAAGAIKIPPSPHSLSKEEGVHSYG